MITLSDLLFYLMIYFVIGGFFSSLYYFQYVYKHGIEEPGGNEIIIFLFFPLYLIFILLKSWFDFLKWLALKLRK